MSTIDLPGYDVPTNIEGQHITRLIDRVVVLNPAGAGSAGSALAKRSFIETTLTYGRHAAKALKNDV